MEEQDLEALDILTPLLLMRKLSAEKFQEQVAGIQARNPNLSVSLEAIHRGTFLAEKGSPDEYHRFSPSVAHFSPRWQSASFTGDHAAPQAHHWGSCQVVSPAALPIHPITSGTCALGVRLPFPSLTC